jgi:hypothetical protein
MPDEPPPPTEEDDDDIPLPDGPPLPPGPPPRRCLPIQLKLRSTNVMQLMH